MNSCDIDGQHPSDTDEGAFFFPAFNRQKRLDKRWRIQDKTTTGLAGPGMKTRYIMAVYYGGNVSLSRLKGGQNREHCSICDIAIYICFWYYGLGKL
jgi:hypothetical protein